MSDSFADLWSSTAPSQPQKPVTLSQQQPSYSQPKPKQDVFALLSQSSTPTNRGNIGSSRPGSSQNFSSTGSRPITPSLSVGSGASRPGSSLRHGAAVSLYSTSNSVNTGIHPGSGTHHRCKIFNKQVKRIIDDIGGVALRFRKLGSSCRMVSYDYSVGLSTHSG